MTRSLRWLMAGALLVPSIAGADDKPDLSVVHRIKQEAFENSKVMDHLFWLTDANGPRLTNSPGHRAAAEWAVRALKEWGAAKPRLEVWGNFGRGWSISSFSISMKEPVFAPLQGMPKAWTSGTAGPVVGEVVSAPLFTKNDKDALADLERLPGLIAKFIADNKGKLRGKVVLLSDPRELEPAKDQITTRFDDLKLAALLAAPDPTPLPPLEWPLLRAPSDPKKRAALGEHLPPEVIFDYTSRRRAMTWPLWAFLRDEGALAVLTSDDRGEGGIVFAEAGGPWEPSGPVPPPAIALTPEAYNRVYRLVQKKLAVKVQVELTAQFTDEKSGTDGINVVAEIPGGRKRDEIVMLGAHLDSWHTATGATDNGAGSAVVLEAFRILKALDLPMDRTVRIALWSGEEQGLLGSRGYVKEHFADAVTMQLKPEHSKLDAYFNLDNGSGKIRGIFLQGNDMARPIFEQWLAPFKDEGAASVTIRNTGGTDHLPFDAVGLPGFQFIQDELDYMTRTHHSELDVYDHAVPADLMEASAVMASIIYDTATRPEMIPRKPLPKPLPPQKVLPSIAASH